MAVAGRKGWRQVLVIPGCKGYSSLSESVKPLAYVSLSSHPHFNLSLEHFLLRSRPANVPLCLLYRNQPCIVIGRNQNPWKELDVIKMRQLGISIVRRRSGGGAVYHDMGNTNYSFHVAREVFTRQQHAELVSRALNQSPISLKKSLTSDLGDESKGAYVNKRNDICISLKDSRGPGPERKISGSAYKIISSRAYHHGTMLLSSNLSNLGSALKPSRTAMQSKGVESVPSPVSNLVDAFASRRHSLTHDHFVQAVLAEFQRTYGEADIHEVRQDDYSEVLADTKDDLGSGWKEMNSWHWTWGQTPEFRHRVHSRGLGSEIPSAFEIDLHVKNGIIQSAEVQQCENEDLKEIVRRLGGKRYDVFGDAPNTFGAIKRVDGLEELQYEPGRQDRQIRIGKILLDWLKTVL